MKKRKDCWIAGTDQISSIFGTDDADGRQEEMPRATRRVLNLNAPHPVHIEDDGRADAGAITYVEDEEISGFLEMQALEE